MQSQRRNDDKPSTPSRTTRPLSTASIPVPSTAPSIREALELNRTAVIPNIKPNDDFTELLRKLSTFFIDAIDVPYTFEQLRTSHVALKLQPLISYLAEDCHHEAIVAGLLGLRYHFTARAPDDRGLSESRGLACEIVAWRFATYLSERELIDYLLFELPQEGDQPLQPHDEERTSTRTRYGGPSRPADETTSLLSATKGSSDRQRLLAHARSYSYLGTNAAVEDTDKLLQGDIMDPFWGLNALEIAVVADAKKFLSQRSVQHVLNGIWNGRITFWNSLSVHTVKKAHLYNKRTTDPYCRLRVPKYQKAIEALFFATFLGLYYTVLVSQNTFSLGWVEILLYVWILAFAHDELSEFLDAGSLFYAADFWSMWDVGIIGVGIAYFITRVIGLARHDRAIIDVSFDILSLEALFLVPRIFSLLSLNPYFGALIPCLKEMTKDFIKFLVLVIILYLGFLTTFTLLARDQFTLNQMSWMLVKVFFGSSYIGFDAMYQINPVLGPPLMLVFVCMTNILLITSLISLLSNSLTKVMDHAKEEYQFIYAVFVLEASTSNRLTYFVPPLNIIPLVLVRPLRLFLPAEQARRTRILLLKITHFPLVLTIWAYEAARQRLYGDIDGASSFGGFASGRPSTTSGPAATRPTAQLSGHQARPKSFAAPLAATSQTSLVNTNNVHPAAAGSAAAGRSSAVAMVHVDVDAAEHGPVGITDDQPGETADSASAITALPTAELAAILSKLVDRVDQLSASIAELKKSDGDSEGLGSPS